MHCSCGSLTTFISLPESSFCWPEPSTACTKSPPGSYQVIVVSNLALLHVRVSHSLCRPGCPVQALQPVTVQPSWCASSILSKEILSKHALVCAAIFIPLNKRNAKSLKWWALMIYFWGGGEPLLAPHLTA